MISPEQQRARAALDAGRAALARLDPSRGSEDLAADLIDVWTAIEAALRVLVGTTVLSGQPLIREARQRQAITFEQANALADFSAAHDRVEDTAYRPAASDIASAQTAFARLDAALTTDPAAPTVPIQSIPTPAVVAAAPEVHSTVVSSTPRGGMAGWMKAAIAVVVLLLVAGGAYLAFGRHGGGSLQQGIDAYRAGQRETAVSAFNKAAKEDPAAAAPHVFLARMAREVGNFTLANQELQAALTAEPTNALALREMGSNLFAQGNYDLARRFYVRALEQDPADKTALGYLGCSLAKLGRGDDAAKFLARAGSGPWSACSSVAPAGPGLPAGTQPAGTQPATGAPARPL